MQALTERELALSNGVRGRPIYVALKGVVYDVSGAPELYGPDGPYHVFAGRECSRALAMMKVARCECNDRLADLNEQALLTLENWVAKFTSKYPIVGQVQKEGKRNFRKFLPVLGGALLIITIMVRRVRST